MGHAVRSNRWKNKQAVRRPDFYELAALQILAQARGASPVAALQLTVDDLIKYLPKSLRDQDAADGVARVYTKLADRAMIHGVRWHQSREAYLNVVKTWDLFGVTFFPVESKGGTIDATGTVLLGVCPHIVNILDLTSMNLQHQLPYKDLFRIEGPDRNRALTLRYKAEESCGAQRVLKVVPEKEGEEIRLYDLIKKYAEYAGH